MNTLSLVLIALVAVQVGCAVDGRGEPSSRGPVPSLCPIDRSRNVPSSPHPADRPVASQPLHVAAVSSSGGIAVFDPLAGALVAQSPVRLDPVVDLAFDGHRGQIAVVTLAGGEAATLSMLDWDPDGPLLCPPAPPTLLEGPARVQPALAGIVAFGAGEAAPWELLQGGDVVRGDLLLPTPRSVWADGDGAWVGTLTVAGGLGARVSLWAGGGPLVAALDDAFVVGETPRSVPSAALEGHLIADLTEAGLRLRLRRDGATVANTTWQAPPGARLEQIAAMAPAAHPGPERERVALWLTHLGPAHRVGTLLVLDVDGALTSLGAATATLEGAAPTHHLFGAAMVVLAHDTLVVATELGPWRVVVPGAGEGLEITPACEGCGLVGPLASVAALP